MKPAAQTMFSVVMATCNRENLIERALKSLVRQTEKDWEAIIVDDGSTDNTCSRILPFLESCKRINYIWKPHSGQVGTKNFGIRAATGKFITFLDSDDEYAADHLELRKRFLVNNPDVRFLYGGTTVLGNQYVPDKNNPSRRINLSDCVIGGTFVIEKDVLLSLNGFRNISPGPDCDLFERAKEKRIKMAEMELPTYIYHHENPDSITNVLFLKTKCS